jgi:hypothetical protein
VSRETQRKHTVHVARGLRTYLRVELALVILAAGTLPTIASQAQTGLVAVIAGLVLVELIGWGALIEGKPWGVGLALGRMAATVALVVWCTRGASLAPVLIAAVALVSAVTATWVLRYRHAPPAEAAPAHPI